MPSHSAVLARRLGVVLMMASAAGANAGSADAADDKAADERTADDKADAPTQLTVRITNLESDKGVVGVALFASAADFPKQERALLGKVTKIQGKRASVTFRDVAPGTYAIAVLHDENQNSKMDFNFLGMPLEGYGFSNDAAAMFGPPSFEDAAFKLKARPSAVSIQMRYFSL